MLLIQTPLPTQLGFVIQPRYHVPVNLGVKLVATQWLFGEAAPLSVAQIVNTMIPFDL